MKLGRSFVIIGIVLVCALVSSCTKEKTSAGREENEYWLVDWTPVSLFLRVTDSKGADLLDPERPDNLIDGTSITFKGCTYNASRQWYETGIPYQLPETKAFLAPTYGLFLVNSEMPCMHSGTAGFSLFFGEIDGGADMDEDLVVTFPNGMTGTIHYHCSNHNERKGTCDRSWKLNGAKAKGNLFTFIVSN